MNRLAFYQCETHGDWRSFKIYSSLSIKNDEPAISEYIFSPSEENRNPWGMFISVWLVPFKDCIENAWTSNFYYVILGHNNFDLHHWCTQKSLGPTRANLFYFSVHGFKHLKIHWNMLTQRRTNFGQSVGWAQKNCITERAPTVKDFETFEHSDDKAVDEASLRNETPILHHVSLLSTV